MDDEVGGRGIIYIATGERYVTEAINAAVQVKAVMPHIPITLFSSCPVAHECFQGVRLIPVPTFSYLDKVKWMAESPYEFTLFLDTDTYVNRDVSGLFNLLSRFEMAVAHASNRVSRGSDGLPYRVEGVPDAFSELNTGVVLFRKTRKVKRFLRAWLASYREQLLIPGAPRHDQPAFRRTLYESGLRTVILAPEYNWRFNFPSFASGEVRIFHGRHPDMSAMAREANGSTQRRVFVPGRGVVG